MERTCHIVEVIGCGLGGRIDEHANFYRICPSGVAEMIFFLIQPSVTLVGGATSIYISHKPSP